jgi:5-methylcytosine-specific restriction enzyme subunit McrC
MTEPVVFRDLSPRLAGSAEEDGWLERVAAYLAENDHILRVTPRHRADDEDEPALYRGRDGHWWAGRFIGELRFEDRELRIEPRLDIGAWLAYALNLSVIPKSATKAGGGPLIAQLVDRMWSAAVGHAARHGGPRLRRRQRRDAVFLRGRLDVPGTIRHRIARRPLLASNTAPRDLDNAVSRVLVLADRTLRSVLPPAPDWRPKRTDELLAQLRGVVGAVPRLPSDGDLRGVRYTPITRQFEPVAHLSFEIARRRGVLTSARRADASGVLLDVAELWELFLVHCARRAFGRSQVEHGTAARAGEYLLASVPFPGRHIGRLKPDILVRNRDGSLVAVIDAKYKRMRDSAQTPYGVDRGDLYQLAAYMAGHDVQRGALAFPPHENDCATAEAVGPWQLASRQEIAFVRLPATEGACIEELTTFASAERLRPSDISIAPVMGTR